MFKSEYSGKLIGPNIKPIKLVVEKRRREYENIVNKVKKVSVGWEIIREINVSPEEAKQLNPPESRRIAADLK